MARRVLERPSDPPLARTALGAASLDSSWRRVAGQHTPPPRPRRYGRLSATAQAHLGTTKRPGTRTRAAPEYRAMAGRCHHDAGRTYTRTGRRCRYTPTRSTHRCAAAWRGSPRGVRAAARAVGVDGASTHDRSQARRSAAAPSIAALRGVVLPAPTYVGAPASDAVRASGCAGLTHPPSALIAVGRAPLRNPRHSKSPDVVLVAVAGQSSRRRQGPGCGIGHEHINFPGRGRAAVLHDFGSVLSVE
jgi:hypothetical protein